MKSYDYAHRKGIEEISWERFGELSRVLTESLSDKKVDIVIGIARAGLFPATAVACTLRRELYPVRVTRRVNDVVRYDSPIWRVDVPSTVSGQRVAVIDEIADTGETLAIVAARALERGARQVWTLSLECTRSLLQRTPVQERSALSEKMTELQGRICRIDLEAAARLF